MSNYAIAAITIVAVFAIIGCIVIINARNKRKAPSWEREQVNDYIEQLRIATERDIPGFKWRQPVIRNLTDAEILNAINMPRQPDDPGPDHNINALGAIGLRNYGLHMGDDPLFGSEITARALEAHRRAHDGLTQTPPPAPIDTVTPGKPVAWTYRDSEGLEWCNTIPPERTAVHLGRKVVSRALMTTDEFNAELDRLMYRKP